MLACSCILLSPEVCPRRISWPPGITALLQCHFSIPSSGIFSPLGTCPCVLPRWERWKRRAPPEILLSSVGAVCAGSFPWFFSVRIWDDLIYQGLGCPGLCPMAAWHLPVVLPHSKEGAEAEEALGFTGFNSWIYLLLLWFSSSEVNNFPGKGKAGEPECR